MKMNKSARGPHKRDVTHILSEFFKRAIRTLRAISIDAQLKLKDLKIVLKGVIPIWSSIDTGL